MDYIAKVDADVELKEGYFARLLTQMQDEPKVGMASGTLLEPVTLPNAGCENSQPLEWVVPDHHLELPWAAAVVWRYTSYQEIGGVAVGPSHESVEAILTKAKGWQTRTYNEPRFKHLRPMGSASGFYTGYKAMGRAGHYLGLPGWLAILKAAHLTLSRHPTKGLGYLAGYAGAWVRRLDRCPHQVVLDHYREERWQRIKRFRKLRKAANEQNQQNEQGPIDPEDLG